MIGVFMVSFANLIAAIFSVAMRDQFREDKTFRRAFTVCAVINLVACLAIPIGFGVAASLGYVDTK
jgi:hypothetical protein